LKKASEDGHACHLHLFKIYAHYKNYELLFVFTTTGIIPSAAPPLRLYVQSSRPGGEESIPDSICFFLKHKDVTEQLMDRAFPGTASSIGALRTFAVDVDLRLLPDLGQQKPLNTGEVSISGVAEKLFLRIHVLHGALGIINGLGCFLLGSIQIFLFYFSYGFVLKKWCPIIFTPPKVNHLVL
jgi:hypothetical protein